MVITHTFEEALKKHIQEIEGKSSIEIVPVIVKRASNYTGWSLFYSLLLALIIGKTYLNYFPFWTEHPLITEALFLVVVFYIMLTIFKRSSLLFYLLPKQEMKHKSTLATENLFLQEAVFETQDRNGILIAIFEFEKTILVLADKGFDAHIDKTYWPKLGAALAQDFNHKKIGDEFFKALTEIENKVAPFFKPRDNNNEIPDHLRHR